MRPQNALPNYPQPTHPIYPKSTSLVITGNGDEISALTEPSLLARHGANGQVDFRIYS